MILEHFQYSMQKIYNFFAVYLLLNILRTRNQNKNDD